MAYNPLDKLSENRMVAAIKQLKKDIAELRTKQTSGSDTLAVQVSVTSLSPAYNLTTSFADVGLSVTITPTEPSMAIIIPTFAWDANGAAVGDDDCYGRLVVDGTPEADLAFYVLTSGDSLATTGNVYAVSLTAAAHTVKLQAQNASGARGRLSVDTTLAYWLFKT